MARSYEAGLPEEILKKYWGHSVFRPLQKEIIQAILAREDVLALLPTGGGKSLCFQVPALMMEGVCLVISPLIALMQDQVARLRSMDLAAACIYSGMHFNEVGNILENALNGGVKLLYVSPERLQTDLFKDYLDDLDLSMVAVDEAHCISQWGHDFRPNYLKIANLREQFPKVPIMALTATATTDVQQDIAIQLKLRNLRIFKQSFARDNLFFEVRYSENKNAEIINEAMGGSNIVYCRSRKQTEALARRLNFEQIPNAAYHAGMTRENREEARDKWMDSHSTVMVATTAFGMGIDKADVRKVLHYDAPEHLEAWYQEAGRAGRDGKAAYSLTLYNQGDIKRLEESTETQFPPIDYLRRIYQSVAEYLQLPIGAEPNRYFPFEIADFCKKFDFLPIPALHGLKLLEREGLWTLTEAVYKPSTVLFVADRYVIDSIRSSYPTLGYISTGLLRLFNTIFSFPTYIREQAVARQLKMSKEELEAGLQQLARMEVIEYNKATEGPQIFFHHRRADSRHLIIDTNRILALRKRHIARTEAMVQFLYNETDCRQRIVLSYFGETADNNCGHCDNCQKRENERRPVDETTLLKIIADNDLNIDQLAKIFPASQKNQVLALLRSLMDKRALSINATGRLRVK